MLPKNKHLIFLFGFSCFGTILANENNVDDATETKAAVLPYVLKRLKQQTNPEKQDEAKHYTLLAASATTSSPNSNSMDEKNEETTLAKPTEDFALAKSEWWPHHHGYGGNHGINYKSHFGFHSGFDLWLDVFKYYYTNFVVGNNAHHPTSSTSHHDDAHYHQHPPATMANAPATLLLLVNLGFIAYILLAIVGALVRLLNVGVSLGTATHFPTGHYHHNNHNYALNQHHDHHSYWRTSNEVL